MGRLPNCLFSQDTPVWGSPLVAEGTCRGARSGVNSTSGGPTKAGWLRDDAYDDGVGPSIKGAVLSLHHSGPLGDHHNRVNLPSADGPEISYCLLIC